MDKVEGHVTLGVWEVGVDTCDLCDEVAVECAMATEPDVRLMRLCDRHAEAAEGMYGAPFRPGGETCLVVTEDDIPCGATTTHVQLITFHQNGEPKIAFWPLCRKHHEARLTNGPEGI